MGVNADRIILLLNIYINVFITPYLKDIVDSVVIPILPFNIEIKADTNKNEYCIEDPNVNVNYIKIQTILHISRINISNSKLLNDIRQIEKDLERTGYLIDLDEDNSDHDATVYSKEHMKASNSLRNILVTFCAFNQSIDDFNTINKINLGYTQGYKTFLVDIYI